jgi:hypothetical protein
MSLSSAVFLPTGFPPGCIPTNMRQLRNSTHVLIFEAEVCSSGSQLLWYKRVQLVSAQGTVLRSRSGASCTIINSPRLANATAVRMLSTGCGIAPAVANGTLPQANCVEKQCLPKATNPASSHPTRSSVQAFPSSPSPDAAVATAASPAPTAEPAEGYVHACKGSGRRNGREADSGDLNTGAIGAKFDLSSIISGTVCCNYEELIPI